MLTVVLLVASNIFMTFAWYGHLRDHRASPLWLVVMASWGLAFFEYCLQVPANRWGSLSGYSAAELKTLQELITIAVFVVFATLYLGEPMRWHHLVGFGLMAAGATFIFKPW
jgi:uncharacterized protein